MVTSLIRNRLPLGPYSRQIPRALRWPYGGGLFLMSEVPLQRFDGKRVHTAAVEPIWRIYDSHGHFLALAFR